MTSCAFQPLLSTLADSLVSVSCAYKGTTAMALQILQHLEAQRFHPPSHVPGEDEVRNVWQIVVRFELWQWLFFFAFTVPIYLICRGVMKCIILFLEANFFETGQTLYYLFGIKASTSEASLRFILFDFSTRKSGESDSSSSFN